MKRPSEHFLLQVDSLSDLDCDTHRLRRHLLQTGVISRSDSLQPYLDLYGRYRREWLDLLAQAKADGCTWANLIDLPADAA